MGWNLHLGSRRAYAAPLKLLTLFVLLSGIPLMALGWLGWRVLQQDRALESQRGRERLDSAASLIARELDRTLSAWEGMLPVAAEGQAVTLPAGSVFLLIAPVGVVGQQGVRLPYYPRVPAAIGADASLFAAGEHHEFREQNLTAAIAAYRALAAAPDPSTRGAALLRLARCFRKQGRTAEAIATYADLAALSAVSVAGSPAELVARRERIALFNATRATSAAVRESALLSSALIDGRFRIDRVTFDFLADGTAAASPPPAAVTSSLAQAIDAVWPAWHEQGAGRLAWTADRATFVTTWLRTPKGIASITSGLETVTASLDDTLRSLQVAARLEDSAGKAVWGAATRAGVTKSARETGLPWSLTVASTEPFTLIDSRRNVFIAGFALMALVVLAASYVAFRAVTRELAVARLQSDFVAAVSHEFRTPLTAMCHLTEMLEQGDTKPERLSDYYRALGKESRRLRTMVENLLDFGRMDSGRRTYDFCETDAAELIDQVAQEFTDRSPAAAHRIEKAPLAAGAALVRADREALTLALRNLVDNAMKYSPDSSSVRVAVTATDDTVTVSVEDHGPGVSAAERRAIFRKFTRGAAARSLNVKGTGIGLTMANQIVKAHGGRLELDSELGRGSIFTMVLPAVPR